METKKVKVPFWAKLRNAKTRIKALESREQKLLGELEAARQLAKDRQGQLLSTNQRLSRVLALLDDATAKNNNQKTMFDYSGLDHHFRETITLEESKQSVMEAASILAMLPHTDKVDERAAYCHTVAECLYEYTDLLNRIG